jgi:hypothetical protein
MFYIIDLQQDPPTRIPGVEFETHENMMCPVAVIR